MIILTLILASCGSYNNQNTNSSSESVAPTDTKVEAAEDVIEWDLSLFGGPREWTTPVEDWAKDMFEETEGRWKITIHYGEALSDAADNLQGVTNGLFESSRGSSFLYSWRTSIKSSNGFTTDLAN